MLSAFKSNAFECLLLFEKSDCKEEAVGYLLYMNEYSFLHGYGYYIDDFFISSNLRGKGLGKMLMHHLYKLAIDNKTNFVKLSFQTSIISLNKLYAALGFINITAPESGLSIYELFGSSNIHEFFLKGAVEYYDLKENYNVNDTFFIIKKQEKGISWLICVADKNRGLFCTFVVQLCYNSWYGMTILFSDFLGDLNVLTEQSLFRAASVLFAPNIACIVWYVPKNVLTSELEGFQAVNVTEEEHWNLAFLDLDRMKSLTSTWIYF